jgi:WD40 repeat protein
MLVRAIDQSCAGADFDQKMLRFNKRDINIMKISHDKQIIVTYGYNNSDDKIVLWSANTYERLYSLTLGEREAVRDIAIHPNNFMICILTVSDEDDGIEFGTIQLWNIITKERIFMHGQTNPRNLNYNLLGDQIIVSSNYCIEFINAFNGNLLKKIEINPSIIESHWCYYKLEIHNGQFSFDQQMVAVTKIDKSIEDNNNQKWSILIYDVETGEQVNELFGHENEIKYISFLNDNDMIVSCSIDNTIRLWNIKTGNQIALIHISNMRSMQVDNTNNIIFCCTPNKIQVLNSNTLELIYTYDIKYTFKQYWKNSIVINHNLNTILCGATLNEYYDRYYMDEYIAEYDISHLIKKSDILFVDLPIEII